MENNDITTPVHQLVMPEGGKQYTREQLLEHACACLAISPDELRALREISSAELRQQLNPIRRVHKT
ncbi:MAG: hypothetical protein ACPG4T_07575 [Nannocystaceae bacterium]